MLWSDLTSLIPRWSSDPKFCEIHHMVEVQSMRGCYFVYYNGARLGSDLSGIYILIGSVPGRKCLPWALRTGVLSITMSVAQWHTGWALMHKVQAVIFGNHCMEHMNHNLQTYMVKEKGRVSNFGNMLSDLSPVSLIHPDWSEQLLCMGSYQVLLWPLL